MGRRFYITDVFCEGKYSGNQLATVVDCDGLSTDEMQRIARGFNFSESTFLLGGDDSRGYDVRIFTPTEELPFAGHPTLGTSYLIQHFSEEQLETVVLNLKVGEIPVSFEPNGLLWMKQRAPTFGDTIEAQLVADSLSLELSDLDLNYPCQFVSTGLEFLLIPLKSLSTLKKCKVVKSLGFGMMVFSPEAYNEHQSISARMFAVGSGIDEDPATGSANGCLASYLVQHEYFGDTQIDLSVGQGYEVQRPSTLHLRASKSASNEFDINVGGKVRLVATGVLHD